jgi:hypothetical protein
MYLLTYILTHSHNNLHTHSLTNSCIYLPSYLPTDPPTHPPTYLPTHPPTYLLAYLHLWPCGLQRALATIITYAHSCLSSVRSVATFIKFMHTFLLLTHCNILSDFNITWFRYILRCRCFWVGRYGRQWNAQWTDHEWRSSNISPNSSDNSCSFPN